MNNRFDEARKLCWEAAIHAAGTSYVFQKKATKYELLLRCSNIVGLLTPMTIGLVALSYGIESPALKSILPVAVVVSLMQGIYSGFAIANKWDSKLAYSAESQSANRQLYEKYKELATLAADDNDFYFKRELLKKEDDERSKQDEKYSLSGKERRMGMRYGLYLLGRECATCKQVPQSMTSTDCGTCGNFKN